jgi:hypothetical protein
VPFTIEHAKAALSMVNAKSPPNGENNQQFKDSAIWQAVLTLSRDFTAHLVTNDRAFFLNPKDPSKGLATNLLEDCKRTGGPVSIHCDLGSCLSAITSDVPSFDQEQLASLVMGSMMPRLQAEAARYRFEIGKPLDIKVKAFRTEQTNRLAVDFTIRVDVDSSQVAGRTGCQAIAYGSCYHDPMANSLSGEFFRSITFRWSYGRSGTRQVAITFESEDPLVPPQLELGRTG